jgi:hypothetical protein
VKSMTNKLLNKKTQEREKEWGDRETESQMGRLGDWVIGKYFKFRIAECGLLNLKSKIRKWRQCSRLRQDFDGQVCLEVGRECGDPNRERGVRNIQSPSSN